MPKTSRDTPIQMLMRDYAHLNLDEQMPLDLARALIANSGDFEDHEVTKVTRYGSGEGWGISCGGGWCFTCPDNELGLEPHVGDTARFYGKGFGYPVRGLALNGQIVFFKTQEE